MVGQDGQTPELWLTSLQQHMNFPLRYITTDDSKVEIEEINDAFGGIVKIHVWLWHVARAWSQKARSLFREPDTQQAQRLLADVLQDLYTIMYEPDILTAPTQIAVFRDKWGGAFAAFLVYLDDLYLKETRRRL
ncbi:unnamed protein product [Mortierella alpina]